MFIDFVDFHALVNAGLAEFGSSLQVLKFDADSMKAGHTSEKEALVSASFKFEMLVVFGSDNSNMEGTKDVLPGMKKFEDWDSGDGHAGVRHVLAKTGEDARSRLIESAQNNLTGMWLLVATDMITSSAQFVKSSSNWISQEFNNLVGQGGDRDDTWKLLCQTIREIFCALHTARQSGRCRFNPGDKASAVMWGCLQAHRRMNAFIVNQFNSDPHLFYILNKHLQDNAATKTETATIRESLATAHSKLERCEKRIHGLVTKVNRKVI